MLGPVQVLVLGLDHPTFTGEVMAELSRLRTAGVVRLVDLLLVSRVDDTTFETLAVPPGLPDDLGVQAAALLGRPLAEGSAGADLGSLASIAGPAWSLADSVPVGSSAVVALIEHLWAAPLREALQRMGATPLDETWLAQDDVRRLEAIVGPSR